MNQHLDCNKIFTEFKIIGLFGDKKINSLSWKIKFTLDIQESNVNFLDLNVSKPPTNDKYF